MTEVEQDFLEFVSEKQGYSLGEAEKLYSGIKTKFGFSSPKFKGLLHQFFEMCQLFYNNRNESEIIKAYKFHAVWHLYRFLSYSYWSQQLDIYLSAAKLCIAKFGESPITVIDYGSGLAYVSFEIARLNKNSKVFLVDIDSLVSEFANFRFKKLGFNANRIIIDKNCPYPKLPQHDVCIAWEVMEHLKQPLKAYQNILNSLNPRGLLWGFFGTHKPEPFHVSPDLTELRIALAKDFEQLGKFAHQKKK